MRWSGSTPEQRTYHDGKGEGEKGEGFPVPAGYGINLRNAQNPQRLDFPYTFGKASHTRIPKEATYQSRRVTQSWDSYLPSPQSNLCLPSR